MSKTQKTKSQKLKIENKKKRVLHAFRRHADLVHEEYGDEQDDSPPIGAVLEIVDWMLDQARGAAGGNPTDIAKVERVRAFVHAKLESRPTCSPSESDLYCVIALAIAAMEKRHGSSGLADYVAAMVEQLDGAPAAPVPMHLPVRVVPHVRRAPRIVPHLYCMP